MGCHESGFNAEDHSSHPATVLHLTFAILVFISLTPSVLSIKMCSQVLGSIKLSVAPEEAACNLTNCLQSCHLVEKMHRG